MTQFILQYTDTKSQLQLQASIPKRNLGDALILCDQHMANQRGTSPYLLLDGDNAIASRGVTTSKGIDKLSSWQPEAASFNGVVLVDKATKDPIVKVGGGYNLEPISTLKLTIKQGVVSVPVFKDITQIDNSSVEFISVMDIVQNPLILSVEMAA